MSISHSWNGHKSFINGNETVEHLLCEYESLTISRSRIFGQSFGELQQLSHVPVDLFRRFTTEIGLAGKYSRGSTIYLKRSQCIGHQWPPHQNKYKYNTTVSTYVDLEAMDSVSSRK